MTHSPNGFRGELGEIGTRNRVAREVIAGFVVTSASQIWQYVADALADTPALLDEVARLRAQLDAVRMARANLAAAAVATVAAHRDGEGDPLSYLRDELAAQRGWIRGRR